MDVSTPLHRARTFVGFGVEAAATYVQGQWNRAWDRQAWASGATLGDKLRAVSLPHAGVGLGALVGVGVATFILSSGDRQPAPPPLPSETAIASAQSAGRAFEAELSPALAEANRTVPSNAQDPRP